MKTLAMMLAFIASVMFSSMAYADHEPPVFYIGKTINVSGTILCDKQDQLEVILTAHQKSWADGVAVYRSFNQTANELNEPACVIVSGGQSILVTFVKQVGVFEGITLPDGTIVTFYIAAVYYARRDGSEKEGFIVTAYPILDVEPTPQTSL